MGGRITLLPKLHCMGEPTLFIDFLTKRSEPFTWLARPGQLQQRIQGRGPGNLAPSYFSTKFFFEKKKFWRQFETDPLVHYAYPVRLLGLVQRRAHDKAITHLDKPSQIQFILIATLYEIAPMFRAHPPLPQFQPRPPGFFLAKINPRTESKFVPNRCVTALFAVSLKYSIICMLSSRCFVLTWERKR